MTAVVLAGAAALGAYEVGVLSHVAETVLPEAGAQISVLCGASAGAINATALATLVDRPSVATQLLARSWSELELGQVIRPSSVELLSMLLDVTGAPARLRRALQVRWIRGGLLDAAPIARLIARAPIASIAEHVAAGRLRGIAISATRVADGAAVVFYQAAPHLAPWRSERNVVPMPVQLTGAHVLASAAIPLLFPPVAVGDATYYDGGLRQIVPLSPAIHLGADRVLVVNPLPAMRRASAVPAAMSTSPLYLAGKALDALFADRVEIDLARLAHTTAILRAGQRRYGPAFARELNAELLRDGCAELRPIETSCIEPSRDLGAMAAEHVTSRRFARSTSGPVSWLMRCIADGDPGRAGDLLAFLLFDGAFTSELIALGRSDARARHAELCTLFASGRRAA